MVGGWVGSGLVGEAGNKTNSALLSWGLAELGKKEYHLIQYRFVFVTNVCIVALFQTFDQHCVFYYFSNLESFFYIQTRQTD